jgi:SsrA-binding protein
MTWAFHLAAASCRGGLRTSGGLGIVIAAPAIRCRGSQFSREFFPANPHWRPVPYNRRMANKKAENADSTQTTVARNRRARHEYEILDEIECGIALVGSEVKSIRNGKISIEEAYARIFNDELWLIDCDIAEYPQANVMNHVAKRTRKLLLKKRELEKVAEAATHKGLTLIPLAIYFSRGFVKVKLAVAKGRKTHDKREQLRKKEDAREMRNATLKRR